MSDWDAMGRWHQTDKASVGPGGSVGHDYLRHYEAFIRPFPSSILEIGVQSGASLRTFDGIYRSLHRHSLDLVPAPVICGIDIDPTCAGVATDRISVVIGDATDPTIVDHLPTPPGGWDLIIDDGSHRLGDVRKTLAFAPSLLAPGGYYIIEDTLIGWGKDFPAPFTEVLAALEPAGLLPLACIRSAIPFVTGNVFRGYFYSIISTWPPAHDA